MELIRRKKLEIELVPRAPAVWAAPSAGLDPDVRYHASSFEAAPRRIYGSLSTELGYDKNIFEIAQNTKSPIFARHIPEFSAIMSLSTRVYLVIPLNKNHKPRDTSLSEGFYPAPNPLPSADWNTDCIFF